MRKYTQHYQGFEATGALEYIQRKSPDGKTVHAEFVAGTREHAEQAIACAVEAFTAWSELPGTQRGLILNRWADRVEAHAEQLAIIDAEEVRKPIRLARGDMNAAVSLIRYAASLASQLEGEAFTDAGPDKMGITIREAIGVVGAILPWNFPGLIFCQKVPFALAAGCTVVVKPSEFTSSSALELAKLAEESGVPAGVITVVTGYGAPVAETITRHPDVKLVTFTGSTQTGQKIIESSASTIKPLSLELGGKAASIVFEDADLQKAAEKVAFAAFFNQGECCVAQSRLLVQRGVADRFTEMVVAETRKIISGDLLNPETEIGSLIHNGHFEKVKEMVAKGESHGAQVITGGNADANAEQDYYPPTILNNVAANNPAFLEEIFGPVLTVTPFDTLEEAAYLANLPGYGLSNSIWSQDITTCLRLGKKLLSGTVYVNTAIDGQPQFAFGGYNKSGYGREMGKHGFEEFTQVKTLSIDITR